MAGERLLVALLDGDQVGLGGKAPPVGREAEAVGRVAGGPSPGRDRRQDRPDPVRSALGDQEVQKLEVVVVQQTSLPVGDLPVEAMQADRIESEPPQVRDLVADDLLVVEPAPARLDVFVVERRMFSNLPTNFISACFRFKI